MLRLQHNWQVILSIGVVAPLTTSGCQYPIDTAAKKAFHNSLGDTSITVFPAYVRSRAGVSHDPAAAESIGAFFTERGLATVNLSDASIPALGPAHRDQARILSESAEAFVAHLTENPVETEYALLPEYLMGRRCAVGVHCYIVDKQNRPVHVVLQNSHWTQFSEVAPKSTADCTEVLIRVLGDDLRVAGSDE